MFVTRHPLHQRGDTIVEVLIAIAVTSLILAGAYATTNHSLLASRDGQEHSAGVKLVEGQLEKLRYTAANNGAALFTTTTPFCITGTSTITSASSSSCSVNAAGGTPTGQPIYDLSIQRVANTFTITNIWPAVSGQGNDQIVMIYRVYQ